MARAAASPGEIEAVTFDYWATLVRVGTTTDGRARRVEALGTRLRQDGHPIGDDQLEAALTKLNAAHHDHWVANQQYTFERAVDELFALLDVDPSAGLLHDTIDGFTGRSSDFLPPLTDNIAVTLAGLRESGVRIGIICDVGLSPSTVLRRHLERHEVLDHFDHWSFSDDVGIYKPAPEIFAHALAGLGGVAPDRSAHVGDLKATDVAGGRAAGFRTIRYRGDNDDGAADGEDADHVIDDHVELLAVLGLDG